MRLLIITLAFFTCCFGQAQAGSTSLDEQKYHWGKTLYCSGEYVLVYALSMHIQMDRDQDIASLEAGGNVYCALLNSGEVEFVETFGLRYGDYRTTIFDEFTHNGTTWYRWRYKQ